MTPSPSGESASLGASASSAERWPRLHVAARLVDRLVHVLDNALPIPGTRYRVGLDPILGLLLPGAGDALGGALSLSVVLLSLQYRVPVWVLTRMVVNLALDAAIGGVPVLGDLFDFAWKANDRNLALLRAHQAKPLPDSMPKRYWLAVFLLSVLALAAVCLPFLVAAWALHALWLASR